MCVYVFQWLKMNWNLSLYTIRHCVLIMRKFQCKLNFVDTMKLMFLLCIMFHIFVFFNIKNSCKWIPNLHSNLFDRMKGSTIFENALVFNIILLVHFNILTDYRLTVNIYLNGYFKLKKKFISCTLVAIGYFYLFIMCN